MRSKYLLTGITTKGKRRGGFYRVYTKEYWVMIILAIIAVCMLIAQA